MNLPGRRAQLIYMDTLSSGGWAVTPRSSLGGCGQHLSCKHYSADRRKQVILQWRNLTHTALASISRLMPTVTSAVNSTHLRCARIKKVLDLCGLPPKTHEPSVIVSKTSDKLQRRDIRRHTPQHGHRQHGKAGKLSQPARASGDVTASWGVVPGSGPFAECDGVKCRAARAQSRLGGK